jgi:hypothetical protein
MWIKDHHERLINSDNVVHFSMADSNKDKKDERTSWVVAARIVKTDWSVGSILYVTEGFSDKDEVRIRLDRIEEGIKNNENFVDLE